MDKESLSTTENALSFSGPSREIGDTVSVTLIQNSLIVGGYPTSLMTMSTGWFVCSTVSIFRFGIQ
jgi:hypothetical protein